MNTNPLPQLLADYHALRGSRVGAELPAMRAAGLAHHLTPHHSAQAVWAALQALGPRQGWLQFQSLQLSFTDGLPEAHPEWGALLRAEAVTAQGDSLAVHRLGADRWNLLRFEHLPQGELLCDSVQHLGHNPALGALRYRRYWRPDTELGPVQITACFIGFEPNDPQGA